MKDIAFKGLSILIILSVFSFDVSALGLQDYLQSGGAGSAAEKLSEATKALASTTTEATNPLSYIIELVIAGIVASALIISILVLFLGRWAGNKEKKLLKAIRIEAEVEKDHVISAAASVREHEKETTELIHEMQEKATQLTDKITSAEAHNEKIIEVSEKVLTHEQELKEVTDNVSNRMNDIQDYWNMQLHDTVATIHKVQSGLDNNLTKVDDNLETMQRQKELSQDLLQDFLNKHNEQSQLLSNNSSLSDKVTDSLEKAFKESNQLLELLKQHQETAEKSLKGFTEELTVYEEQAYEQFDTTFQVADLARQELTANIDESRKHIETMRRHEEQSHNINAQTQKNLELLDYSKIMKLSTTLDSTHDMFTDIRSRVEETRLMLDELKDIETDIREKSKSLGDGNTEREHSNKTEEHTIESLIADSLSTDALSANSTSSDDELSQIEDTNTIFDTEYKMASGDFTPLSFFKNINQKNTSTDD